jgi:hypothetical protein
MEKCKLLELFTVSRHVVTNVQGLKWRTDDLINQSREAVQRSWQLLAIADRFNARNLYGHYEGQSSETPDNR